MEGFNVPGPAILPAEKASGLHRLPNGLRLENRPEGMDDSPSRIIIY